ncbi:hypothetical protein EG327_004928 [Venturia inaequalis]|uniref:Histidine kinase n=1 Tax=Venturia inaequalis TaxID=5025 RepID=A0A8H3ZC04_VENIN|nr:hypothetical protein EG327_004928 [Venturia inaequalis]
MDSPLPSLAFYLNADPLPSFIIPIDLQGPIDFELYFCNDAFTRDSRLSSLILGDNKFKHWCQTASDWRDQYDFANYSWTAFAINHHLQSIRASSLRKAVETQEPVTDDAIEKKLKEASLAITKLQSLERLFEISQIGTFEYDQGGDMIRANEAYYRMTGYPKSCHQKNKYGNPDFSFMDIVYPPDLELAASMWGTLLLGKPACFEIRIKKSRDPPTTAAYPRCHSTSALNLGFEDEDFLWVIAACAPIMDDARNVVYICGNTTDISAQKRVQSEATRRAEALERAEESEQIFAHVAEMFETRMRLLNIANCGTRAPVGIYVFDGEQNLTFCNEKFFEITGHPRTPFQDIDWRYFIHADDVHIGAEAWRTLLEDKTRAFSEWRTRSSWRNTDGLQRQGWVESIAIPELDSEGNVTRVVGIVNDITRYKDMEDTQRNRIEEAIQEKLQKENFIDITSHEVIKIMRNPLSAVLQSADAIAMSLEQILSLLLWKGFSPATEHIVDAISSETRSCLESVQTIVACSLHQKNIIDDVLTLSKLDSNMISIFPIRSQPVEIVKDTIRMFAIECLKEGIGLEFVEDGSLLELGSSRLMFDPLRFNQVLINLLTNAIKFTRDRSIKEITVTLGITSERPSDHWDDDIAFAEHKTIPQDLSDNPEWGTGRKVFLWVKVRDTGCGIAVEEQHRLFKKFTQADSRTHITYGGSGLGLFISKSLTELCSGNIGVSSTPQVGSTFAFFIGTRISISPDPEEDPMLWSTMSQRSVSPEVPFKAVSVLLVEDNLVNQKVLSKQLEKAGFIVYIVGHGGEALNFLRTTKFWRDQNMAGLDLGLVLMDIEMPVMGGLECARKIRELQQSGDIVSHVPIMAVTANARVEQLKIARESGMDDAIAKPFRIVELLPKIEMLARRWSQ